MKIEESLTKENFWDEIESKYPNAFKVFSNWIDEYKKAVNWNKLFNEVIYIEYSDENQEDKKAPKFHDLPHAMQLGIWISFISNYIKETYNDHTFVINITNDYNLKVDIEKRLDALEELLINPLNPKD